MRSPFALTGLGLGCAFIIAACASQKTSGFDGFGSDDGGSAASSGSSSSSSGGGVIGSGSGSGGGDNGGGGSSGGLLGDGGVPPDGGGSSDPQSCDQAAMLHSYIGCDYWPTVVANQVWSIFDYAVVVANAGNDPANITVTGPSNTNQTATVAPGQLTTLYLPWVPDLKGPDQDECAGGTSMTASVMAPASAYHLVSSVPVTVYQFNAIEYVGQGGPPGKDWSSCPGNQVCQNSGNTDGCYTFTNDASLLLPSSAMTPNYRITGHGGWWAGAVGGYAAITATQNNTRVTVTVSSTGTVLAGNGIARTAAGGTLTLQMNAGDVAELFGGGTDDSDLSGSLVQASAPVQVITGMQCTDVPDTSPACDHIEESNFPVETLGKDYVVAQPAAPNGQPVGQMVRIYGNVDGTKLTYTPSTPAGCPTTINAGQVVDCGGGNAAEMQSPNPTSQDFEVTGTQPFAVGVFTQGASVVDPNTQPPNQQGDPDQSLIAAVEQYRTKYVFLAPTDYQENYVVVVAPMGATVTLDGATVSGPTPVGSNGFGALRVKLGPGQSGAHVLTATQPVGLQVMGYGAYTSYQYPGGLNLKTIAPPPPPPPM
jgi:hypothetical protein